MLRPRAQRIYRRRRIAVGIFGLGFLGVAGTGAALVISAPPDEAALHIGQGTTLRVPGHVRLSPLRTRIVSIAESQVGYATDPPTTYCNKYSAYWASGPDDCGNGNRDEEWCADFAAWVWQQAGATVVYQYINGDLNSSAASFYEWGSSRGTWHPVGSGYVPQPGDVAVYGLDAPSLVASHVAIVVGYKPGNTGPDAVNGDGDVNGFSVVEVRPDESFADTTGDASLSGYVSPSQ